MKRFLLALAFAGLLSPAYSAGTIPYSLSQQLDEFGKPLAGCHLYIIQAGTPSTPQIAYQDAALTIPAAGGDHLRCNAAGRLPQFFLADGSVKIRLTKSNGPVVVTADGIAVIGASSGGGGGSPVDATTVLATGDIKARHGTGALSGFVRANGRTIGSASSGATERANADCQSLFEYLWDADSNLTVSTGRGASANADWVANKTIALPDFRSRTLAGLGDMGNTDNAMFAGVTFTLGNSTTLGSLLGNARRTLSQANLPNVTLVTTVTDPGHTHANSITQAPFALSSSGSSPYLYGPSIGGGAGSIITANTTGITASTSLGGSGTAFDTITPYALVTLYMKL